MLLNPFWTVAKSYAITLQNYLYLLGHKSRSPNLERNVETSHEEVTHDVCAQLSHAGAQTSHAWRTQQCPSVSGGERHQGVQE